MDRDLLDAIRELVADLAAGRLAEIEADGRAGRLSASELRTAIRDYGRTLVPLPGEAASSMCVYPSQVDAARSAVDVPMWTVEEERAIATVWRLATCTSSRGSPSGPAAR